MMAFFKPSAERISRRSVSRFSCEFAPGFGQKLRGGGDRGRRARDFDANRVVQELFGDAPDFCRHGGGEEQRLPGERHELADALDVGNEAHVEHAVGFVNDQKLDAAEEEPPALEMIEQPARSCDQHVDAAGKLGILVVERNPADQKRDVQFMVGAVFGEAFLDLRGKLAGRLEDQGPRHACPRPALFEHGQHRQHEGCRLAGAGLRNAEHVAPIKHVRDGLILDRGRDFVTGRRYGGEYFFG